MADTLLAVDAGSTSLRALAVSAEGALLGQAVRRCAASFPGPGRVEHDPVELGRLADEVVAEALAAAGRAPADLLGLAITSQRSCVVVWERESSVPLSPLVSWQDLRAAELAAGLAGEGYAVAPQSAIVKLGAVLDGVAGGRERARRGELCWGGVDSYLVARWCGSHLTDATQACATGAYDYEHGDWDPKLLERLELPAALFPKIVDTAGVLASTKKTSFGAAVPLASVVADQQSAALAHGIDRPGDAKVTLGTSATANVATGPMPLQTEGSYPLVLWQRVGERSFCLEAMVLAAGALLEWIVGGLGLYASAADLDTDAASVSDAAGVALLPALHGLGSPHNQPERRALLTGMSAGTTRAHVARAALEAICFRVLELLEGIYQPAGLEWPEAVRIDGGVARSRLLPQLLADCLGRPVQRFAEVEATAWGAIGCAAQGLDIGPEIFRSLRRYDPTFEPRWSEDERETRFGQWRSSLGLSS